MLIAVIGQVFFPLQANGSLIYHNNQVAGSSLIGQQFDSTRYFWSRPSATGYNTFSSGSSNLGPGSKKLVELVKNREINFRKLNKLPDSIPVPSEMVFASGSGLDPHISVESALLQVNRIALSRDFNISQKNLLISHIKKITKNPQFHIFGQARVNVLLLNLELDKIK